MELREAVKHPWVTVEGSLVPEGLSPTDTSSGEEVEVCSVVCIFTRHLFFFLQGLLFALPTAPARRGYALLLAVSYT